MTTLDDIAARDAAYDPLDLTNADPFQAIEDRRYLLNLVREAREALQTISDADGEGRARFIAPLLARLTEGSDRT